MMFWNGNDMGGWGYALTAIGMVRAGIGLTILPASAREIAAEPTLRSRRINDPNFWGAVITGIVLLVRSSSASSRPNAEPLASSSAENLLAERFARGEIDESEFSSRVAILRSSARS